MIFITKAAGWVFDTVGGKALSGVGFVVALIVWWKVDQSAQRAAGRRDMARQIEEQNHDVKTRAAEAGRRSRDPAAGGVRNPYYRAD